MKTWLRRLPALLIRPIVFLPGIGAFATGITMYSLMSPPDLSNPHLYAQYISGYTSGMISAKSQVAVHFNFDSAIQLDSSLQKKVEDSPFMEFSPSIDGQLYWTSKRSLVFEPKKRFEQDQEYYCTVNLGKINPSVPKKLRDFTFRFKIMKQDYRIAVSHTEPINFESQTWQRLTGTLSFNDIPDTTEIRKSIHAKQDNRDLKISWGMLQNYADEKEITFYVDSVERKQESTYVEIEVDGDKFGVERDEKLNYQVRAMGDFGIVSTAIQHEQEQCLVLSFSDPIKSGQNLANIIRIEGQPDPRCLVMGTTVKVYPQQHLKGEYRVLVSTALQNAWGYHMNKQESMLIYFEPPKPNVRMVSNGVILPNTGKLFFPFESIATKAVDVTVYQLYENNILQFLQINSLGGQDEIYRVGKRILKKRIELNPEKTEDLNTWKRYAIDLSALFKNEPGAMYRVQFSIPQNAAIWECNTEEETTENEENQSIENTENDFSDFEYGYSSDDDGGPYNSDPCDPSYYQYMNRGRNVLASDLGITVKQQPNKETHVCVSSIMTTDPIQGAVVQFYNYQQQLIQTLITDKQGMASSKLSVKPFVIVVKHGNQNGYVKTDDGSALSLSNFDVDGARTDKGLKGFIYGERGIWRPGDSLFLNFILEDSKNVLPENHPVSFELLDPSGRIVQKIQKTNSVNGFYDFRTATDPDAPTGFWLASVNVGNKRFTKNIRIETVKPNRLKIYLENGKPEEIISSANRKDSALLSAKWLHGAIAKNLRADVEVTVNSTPTHFKKFTGYCFDDPTKTYESQRMLVFDGQLNSQGKARFNSKINVSNSAPGFLKASYLTRVFEEGGDVSIDRFSSTYSIYRSYAGISIPITNVYRPVLETEKSHEFGLANVLENGENGNSDLQVKIFRLDWEWWWDSFDDDIQYYLSRPGVYPVFDTLIHPKQGKASFKFKLGTEEWGRYLIRVTDKISGHSTGKVVFFDSPWWSRSNSTQTQFASMLSFSSDKEKYRAGEEIKLSIPSAGKGKALVSIENGERIIKKFWVNTVAGETQVKFEATGEMGPSCYVFVSLLQPHETVKNDLPMRMYGIIPITIDDPKKELNPIIETSKEFSPESIAKISVKEQNGKPMTYTLAIVDEGLLDLTRFKTPHPKDEFYQKEALGIKTWDMFDWIIGAYGGKLNKVLSIGGDGSGINNKGAKANRFKPMVRFIGPFTLQANQNKQHAISIPQYVGSVRIMVVAGNKGAYGNAEKTVPVKKPLMVLATLPRVLGPEEEVALPVNVFAMDPQIKQVDIRVETNDFFSINGGSVQSIVFNQPGDEVINFKLNVASKCGIAKVKVIATCGKEKAIQEIEIDIRPSNGPLSSVERIKIPAGKSGEISIELNGLDGSNSLEMEASLLPIELSKRLNYLIQYPHGCVEQTTSAAFPQLAMQKVLDLSGEEKLQISKNIKSAINRLGKFQTPSGGFAYWPGMSEPNPWGTNYAGHFLMEAERAGYALPIGLKTRWVEYQKRTAQNWNDLQAKQGDQLEQSYRLYVLALSKQAEIGAMNRLRELKNIHPTAKWRLAAAYALIGQPETAHALIAGLGSKVEQYQELSGTFGSHQRDEAMILQTLVYMKEKKLADLAASKVIENLNQNTWMSTQSTAWSLLAIQEYMQYGSSQGGVHYSYQVDQKSIIKKSVAQGFSKVRILEKSNKRKVQIILENNGTNDLHFRLTKTEIAKSGNEKSVNKRLKMLVRFTDLKGNTIPISVLDQGTDFIAEVTLVNPEKTYLKEMALTQIFPSGWEIRNSRMDASESPVKSDAFVFQDIRDDRISTYFSLGSNQAITYRTVLNAAYQGKFYLPAVIAEAMYNHEIQAVDKGKWVEVRKPQNLANK